MKIKFTDIMDRKTLTPEQIAKHHNVSIKVILKELELGIKEEMKEHTSNKKLATEIALDHLKEDARYYSKGIK